MISLTVCMWYWKINNEEDRMVININIIKKEASPQINALQIFWNNVSTGNMNL